MRVRIHRGTQEIGGSCIEVAASSGERIVLDVGRPLWAGWDEPVPLPEVSGFDTPADPTLLGVVISHPHLDHYGLVSQLPASVPVYIGKEAAALLDAARFFSPATPSLRPAGFLADSVPVVVGPFTITPTLNDHSAFDAYSLLIEVDGRRLFYTGDLRAHGRKAALFERLVAHPPPGIDVLLMEGTHVRPDGVTDTATSETERDLEERFVALNRATVGCVAVFGSVQNLDRLVTVFRAARRTGRTLVVDLYGATVAAATRATIPQPGFDGLAVYVPQRQRVLVKQHEEFWRTRLIALHRIYPETLAASPGEYMLHTPASTARELVAARVLDRSGAAVWSMWSGYLTQPSGTALQALLGDQGIRLTEIHTSGHASVPDLRRLVDAVKPQRLVPIHSQATDRFADLFPHVDLHADGEWWTV